MAYRRAAVLRRVCMRTGAAGGEVCSKGAMHQGYCDYGEHDLGCDGKRRARMEEFEMEKGWDKRWLTMGWMG